MRRPRITLVAAVARNAVIGDGRKMPWHLPEDMAHFRQLTEGHPVLMGRRTWDSLPERFRPLPRRRNLVLSRDSSFAPAGAERMASLADAIAAVANEARLFVIGGAGVYREALPFADELALTEIERDFEGSVRFPEWNKALFDEQGRERRIAALPNDFEFSFVIYRRKDQPNE